MLEQQKIEERNALNDKLKTAANLRDENIKRILERLREHVSLKTLSIFPFQPQRIVIITSFVFTLFSHIINLLSIELQNDSMK